MPTNLVKLRGTELLPDDTRERYRQKLARITLDPNNGPDALREIDLLFTDIGLPGLTGRELTEEALRHRPKLKVLYATAYARNSVVHHGRLDPGVQLISKPFTRADLATKIRTVTDGGAR
jgi:CheY-like chemotaxis protein